MSCPYKEDEDDKSCPLTTESPESPKEVTYNPEDILENLRSLLELKQP